MAILFQVLRQFVVLAVYCFVASLANPITMPPTTAVPTMAATTQVAYDSYLLIVQEVEMFQGQFTPMLNSFLVSRFPGDFSSQKTDRLLQSDAQAPDLDIRGFLTVNDLPPTFERHSMTEAELLPKHKMFLQTYDEVMKSLKTEEVLAVSTHPESYSNNFTPSYDEALVHIRRLLYKVSELMTLQNIADGPSQTFDGFQALPHNYQIHNTRSLYVLQSIDEYISASLIDYHRLLSQSQS
ncbi:uncharacterized protein LOC583513 isoform X1 [Strongylocentrotus purpuratus]|uniref:Uncharacterized protein n=1 Tax=Strongylocentrotus purpuratus TaxID=7668 RepID=A0A7M7HMW2_STRPU|nr:uncharacterized protein LOC583513 isoform X1 [Strongylocentrotus purpuratus]|eukprot:XP_011679175.1 PREDICTED: uncharacterized protein LOC583513 isoform X1 [Strongylocentrotus purpuratus]